MIFRLITTIIAMVALAFFVGFNLENKCDVNIIFYTFKQTPVFFTIIISFVIGVIFTLPFAFIHRSAAKNKEKQRLQKKEFKLGKRHTVESSPDAGGMQDAPADAHINPSVPDSNE
ncbi:MAG: hypothetical protein ACTTKL_09240 [Treponema sp.]